MSTWFQHRHAAGRRRAAQLAEDAAKPGTIVLRLARAGVPLAYESAARRFGLPPDVFVVRKLAIPGYVDAAIGAIASVGVERDRRRDRQLRSSRGSGRMPLA